MSEELTCADGSYRCVRGSLTVPINMTQSSHHAFLLIKMRVYIRSHAMMTAMMVKMIIAAMYACRWSVSGGRGPSC